MRGAVGWPERIEMLAKGATAFAANAVAKDAANHGKQFPLRTRPLLPPCVNVAPGRHIGAQGKALTFLEIMSLGLPPKVAGPRTPRRIFLHALALLAAAFALSLMPPKGPQDPDPSGPVLLYDAAWRTFNESHC